MILNLSVLYIPSYNLRYPVGTISELLTRFKADRERLEDFEKRLHLTYFYEILRIKKILFVM